MQQVEINAEIRNTRGSAASRRLLREDKVPAVLYGHEIDGISLILDRHKMDHLLGVEGFVGLIDLKISDETKGLSKGEQVLALVKDYQADPITRELIHIDLYRVDLNREVTVAVPLHVEGAAPGVKEGGILDIARREIEVRCLPNSIPESLVADVSELQLGHSLHMKDIILPEGISTQSDINYTVVTVALPTKVEEPVVTEEAEVAVAEGAEEKPAEEQAEEKKEGK
jgi:large subunit ribosomal protein L25